MKKVITGIISVIGILIVSFILLPKLQRQWHHFDTIESFLIVLVVFHFISFIFYLFITKFWIPQKPVELEALENENKILKKRIEQKELMKKLEED